MGDNAYLWSSSPVDDDARGLSVDPSNVSADKGDNRANAHSVRCFKDSSAKSLPAEFQVNFWQGFKLIFT